MANRRLAFAVDKLSKNTLADILVDRAMIEIGEDASDEQIAAKIEAWLRPVEVARGDKNGSLVARLAQWDRSTAIYLDKAGAAAEAES